MQSSRDGKRKSALGDDSDSPFRTPREILGKPPDTPDVLHAWLRTKLGFSISRRPLVAGHQAPFDYLCHAFFEGRIFGESAGQPASWRSPDCIVWANRGGGKTWLGALATLLDLLFKPGIQVRILGGSLDQSLRMRASLCGFLEHDALAEVERHVGARRITIFHDRETRVKSIVEVLAASQTSVRGTRVQKLRCDEVDLFDPEVWEAAQLVTRSMPCEEGPWGKTIRGSVEALSTMHRPFGLMWTLVGPQEKRARERKVGRAEESMSRALRPTFRWGVLDVLEFCTDEHTCSTCILYEECAGRAKTERAPQSAGHIPVADAIAQKARVSRDTWESEMLCLRPSRGDTVYPAFDAATHVVGDPVAPFERYIGGMDFGYRNEGALLLAGIDRDGGVTVLREFVRRGVRLDDYIATLQRWLDTGVADRAKFEFLGVDPAGAAECQQSGASNIQILRDRGFKVRTCKSDIHRGVLTVRGRIDPTSDGAPAGTPPRLLVHHSCTRLIECLTRYKYNPDRPDDLNPMKDGHDHAPDALRYMIVNLDKSATATCEHYT
jgi:hypothetical protein